MALLPPIPGPVAGRTSEAEWRAALANAALPELTWRSLGTPDRALVLDTVPGEGIFAIGGLLAGLTKRGCAVDVVTLSAGDVRAAAAYGEDEIGLATRRLREHRSALDILLPASRLIYLKLPVEALAGNEGEIADRLTSVTDLAPAQLVFAPYRLDGAPAQESVGAAAAKVAAGLGALHVEMPVQLWHTARPENLPWSDLWQHQPPPAAVAVKTRAMACFTSQIVPAPMAAGASAPLGEQALVCFERPVEVVVADRLRLR